MRLRGELHWEWVRKHSLSISVDIKCDFYTFSGIYTFYLPIYTSFPYFVRGRLQRCPEPYQTGGQVADIHKPFKESVRGQNK